MSTASSIGLCANCIHKAVTTSSRGSEFIRCKLSETDERFPKYPRLPVLSCIGYKNNQEHAKKDNRN